MQSREWRSASSVFGGWTSLLTLLDHAVAWKTVSIYSFWWFKWSCNGLNEGQHLPMFIYILANLLIWSCNRFNDGQQLQMLIDVLATFLMLLGPLGVGPVNLIVLRPQPQSCASKLRSTIRGRTDQRSTFSDPETHHCAILRSTAQHCVTSCADNCSGAICLVCAQHFAEQKVRDSRLWLAPATDSIGSIV